MPLTRTQPGGRRGHHGIRVIRVIGMTVTSHRVIGMTVTSHVLRLSTPP
jgi:hypothetical protein